MSSIDKYDQELERDIATLQKDIDEDEELAKMDFQNLGCPKEIAEQIARKEKKKGKHMLFDPTNERACGVCASSTFQSLSYLSDVMGGRLAFHPNNKRR